ncbi:hypothetical protein BURKHO8Y_120099 [Burkholderia sp. 8Y]|nr:hypothetical protein BURKHO8Y_120099 [Burkholderia sp. 8Y]
MAMRLRDLSIHKNVLRIFKHSFTLRLFFGFIHACFAANARRKNRRHRVMCGFARPRGPCHVLRARP